MAADWMAIKTEYVTTRASMQKLAEKYGVSVSAIKRRSAAEKWAANRTRTEPKVYQKTVQKVIEKTANQEADRITRLLAVSDKLLRRVEQAADAMEDDIDAQDIQRLTTAIKNLRDVAQTGKGDDPKAGSLSVNFEGRMKEGVE